MYKLKKMLLLLLTMPLAVFAQEKTNTRYTEQQKVYEFFENNTPLETTKDSTMVYAFAFKVMVKKAKNGQIQVNSITANDTVAYTVYPGYKFLTTIDYSVFMKNRTEATFIFPVLLEIYGNGLRGFKGYISPFETVTSLFWNKRVDKNHFEDYIYFPAVLLRMDKNVYN